MGFLDKIFKKKEGLKSPKGFNSFLVKEVVTVTNDSVKVVFDIPSELRNDYSYTPGQYITLAVQIDGDEVRRSYSICSGPHESLAVAIKKVPNGKVSTWANQKLKVGDDVPISILDKIKQGLWDVAEGAKENFKATGRSRAYDGLRRDLTNKIDALSPKTATGEALTAQARATFAGPAALKSAIEAGRDALKGGAVEARELVSGMTPSEMQAFRVGVVQALREKAGTEGGQTTLLKAWKEPATADKLKELFGGDYRQFAAEVAREARLKLLDSVGRGSQTAARLYGAGDMDNAVQIAGALAGAAHGNPVPAMGTAAKIWNRVQTPEATRDELARMLLQRGPAAERELQNLPGFIQSVNAGRARRASLAGALTGQATRETRE
jgi:hypothetical protein